MIELLFISAAAGADIAIDGEIRETGRLLTDFGVDAEGTTHAQDLLIEQRIRLGGAVDLSRILINLEGDVLTGPLAGDAWGIATPGDVLAVDQRQLGSVGVLNAESFTLRKASVSGHAGPLQLSGGVTTSHWGLGMVANDGNQFRLFGQTRFGDRVIRLRATTRLPDVPLYFSGAVDRVIEDELARTVDGQAAYQAVLSTIFLGNHGHKVGAYVVARTQDEVDEVRATNATLLDVYVDMPFSISGVQMRAAAEVAGIRGSTTRALSYGALDELPVRALGATGELEVGRDRAALLLRAGYASGDGNLDDDTAHDFTFDRDFEVGMVMFPEVMGAVGAGTYAMLDDPAESAEPPPGAETVVTEGAFQRATFLSPVGVFTVTPWLTTRAGAVLAWSTAPIAQPFYTLQAGGTPTSHHDQPTTGYRLGTEALWGASVGNEVLSLGSESIRASLDVQGGHAFLSPDMAGPGPSRVDMYMLAGRLTW